jgi:alanine racemase
MIEGTDPVLDVDLDAVAANWRTLCGLHPSGAVALVVKADAYGLGAVAVATRLHREGCRHVFVARLSEALPIAKLLPDTMLAALEGFVAPADAEVFVASGIVPVLNDLGAVATWAERARALGRALPAILHIDTGMSRLGLDPRAVETLAADPDRLGGIDLLYVMTHFVSAEIADDTLNAAQASRFAAACDRLPQACRSLANSSGIFLGASAASDLARPGAALYGINPTPDRANPMRPVVHLTAPVLQIREIAAGETVGYNATWRASRRTRIATVGIGYADGLHRTLSSRGQARFDGQALPLVGRLSMDLTTFDATDCPALSPGDRVTLIGPGLDADAVAAAAGTNAYEVLTSLSPRIRRRHLSA